MLRRRGVLGECDARTQGAFVAGGYGRNRGRRSVPPRASRRHKASFCFGFWIGLRSVNGSTRPLYGRGAGSTPAGGFVSTAAKRQRSRQRLLSLQWRHEPPLHADVAQREEHRSATPEGPVRSGSSASSSSTGPWCNGSMASSNLAGPGSTPGGPARFDLEFVRRLSRPLRLRRRRDRFVAGRRGPVTWLPAVRLRARAASTRPRLTSPAAGRNGSGYRLRIDRSRVRVPPGALALR